MSLLSSVIATQIVKILEEKFLACIPELQQAFIEEISVFVKIITDWIESKINSQGVLSHEKK
jgi:hypothetical protein